MQRRIPKGILSVTLPLFFQATVFRKRGGYYYRHFVVIVCLAITTFAGSAALLAMRLLGRDQKCFGYLFKFHFKLAKTFLAFDTIVEGRENFLDASQSAVYVCNHQTMMDVQLMGNSVPDRASIVVKKEIKYYPFFGQFSKLL